MLTVKSSVGVSLLCGEVRRGISKQSLDRLGPELLIGVSTPSSIASPGADILNFSKRLVSGTIIRGTLKSPNSQLVTPISIKLQRPDGCD
jgi:hypothetical protein